MEETKRQFTLSDLKLYNRTTLEITGVDEVLGFDDSSIVLSVCGTKTVIEGEELKITLLSVEEGRVFANGRINGIYYEEDIKPKKGFVGRLFKG